MILGIDTSCYTTSVALCDSHGRLLSEKRRLLPVKQGERGLRQSDAVFLHLKALPDLLAAAFAEAAGHSLQAVSVSSQPRPVAGSYMPVFLAGQTVASSIAVAAGLPCYATSHQEGHLAAAMAAAGLDWQEAFLAFHLSGGTGEILQVVPRPAGYEITQIGDSDLPPGQLVDRVGVALGLPFPAGPHLEALAAKAQSANFRLHSRVTGLHLSFSGPESAAQRAILAGEDAAEIALAVLDVIAKSLGKAICQARQQTNCKKVLLVGGVAANQHIKAKLQELEVFFADPAFAGDNASGVAYLGWQRWQQEHGAAEQARPI